MFPEKGFFHFSASPCSISAILELEQASESRGGAVKTHVAAPPPCITYAIGQGRVQIFAFLTSSQMIWVLQFWGTDLENH